MVVGPSQTTTSASVRPAPVDPLIEPSGRILVTGSAGFIGGKVVETLCELGWRRLRLFVRPSSNRRRLEETLARMGATKEVEIVTGDLLSREDARRAAEGVSVIYHLAAGIEKSFAGAFMNSVLTTRNLVEAFLDVGTPRRFVNVSSFAVYSNWNLRPGAVFDESCPLETSSQERCDPYGFGKLKQDELVMEYGAQRGLPYVILRPGMVFGPGKRSLSGRVGNDTFGVFLHMGGSKPLPATYVDNCAEAIVLAGLRRGVDGEIFNVVDDDQPTSGRFLRAYKEATGGFLSVPVPYSFAYLMSSLWEKYSRWSGGQLPPVFNRRRCSAEWKRVRFSNRKLREKLGWAPRVGMAEAMRRFLDQYRAQSA